MENTEKLIVEQLKNGNEDAYKYIYDYHYVLLCHVANQYLNDNFLSETIVGDVIRELEHEIRMAIDKLPVECRCVFEKSRFEEKKYEEISQELGISINTVKYHIKNALSFLQTELSKYLIALILFFSC